MLQLLIQWLPDEVGIAALAVAIAGALTGGVLWLSGARFSRTLTGLVAVFVGAVVGLQLPHWMGWTISGAGPAVGMALVGGLAGYVFHRLWIGVGLGMVLAGWGFLAMWVMCKAPANFDWPSPTAGSAISDYILQLWQSLPANVAHAVPFACGGAMVIGLITTIFLPRLAIATAWSAAGASLLVGLGSAAMQFGRPQWIGLLPQHLSSQLFILTIFVIVGAAAQWKTAELAAGQTGSTATAGSGTGAKSKPSPRPVSEGAD